MLRRQQPYDDDMRTGAATIHVGKPGAMDRSSHLNPAHKAGLRYAVQSEQAGRPKKEMRMQDHLHSQHHRWYFWLEDKLHLPTPGEMPGALFFLGIEIVNSTAY